MSKKELQYVTNDELFAWEEDCQRAHDWGFMGGPSKNSPANKISRLIKEIRQLQTQVLGQDAAARNIIFGMVAVERLRQNQKYSWEGYCDHHKALALMTEAAEVSQSVLKEQGREHTIQELVQTAAVAVRWLEQLLDKGPQEA